MKIYFENGILFPFHHLQLDIDFCCDAGFGYSDNIKTLNKLYNENPNCSVYTNSLAALSNTYAWNDEIDDVDIFMRENNKSQFKRISELYGGKIRISQNVRNMFISGRFGCL